MKFHLKYFSFLIAKRRCSTNIDSLGTIVETLTTEKEKIMTLMIRISSSNSNGSIDIEFLRNHHNILTNAIAQLQDICVRKKLHFNAAFYKN